MPKQLKPWADLEALFRKDEKTRSRKVGVEIERPGLWEDGSPLHYNATPPQKRQGRFGARDLLLELAKKERTWRLQGEDHEPLGFITPFGKVSLEPGSQVEFATLPERNICGLCGAVTKFEKSLEELTSPSGLQWVELGVNPFSRAEDVDVIPLPRYGIMTKHLGKTDRLGTSMMRLTASLQINIDYFNEEDAIEMLRVAFVLVPISYALFANSPIYDGKVSPYLSFRNHIWQHTEKARCGILDEVFDEGYSFDRYAEHLWKYPLMYYERKAGDFVAANGLSLEQLSKKTRNVESFKKLNLMHAVRQIFTEARLKPNYIEIRSLDLLPSQLRWSSIAFWLGMLDNSSVRKEVLSIFAKQTKADRKKSLASAVKEGLNGKCNGESLGELAERFYGWAEQVLRERGFGENDLLEPLGEVVESGINPAERVKEVFRTAKNPTKFLQAMRGDRDRTLSGRKLSVLCEGKALS